MKIYFKLLFAALLTSGFLQAQKKDAGGDLGDAAANAVNPGAFVTKMQIQPNFTWKDNKARQLLFNSRIIQPSASVLLPFIKSKDPSKVYTLYRLEVPIISQTFPKSPAQDGTGLSDLTLLDLVSFKRKWGLFGFGPGLIIPTVKPKTVSGGKWCLGPTAYIVSLKTKGLIYGVSAQQFFSFAGDDSRAKRNFLIFNPFVNKILTGGFFISTGPMIMFDWENKDTHVPLTFSIGRAFAKNLSMLIAPQYMLSGPNKGDFTFQFQVNTMFPPKKK